MKTGGVSFTPGYIEKMKGKESGWTEHLPLLAVFLQIPLFSMDSGSGICFPLDEHILFFLFF